MKRKVKAAVMKEFGAPLVVEDVDSPNVGPMDALVKVGVCGVCYSDVKIWQGRVGTKATLPHIMGHEIAGTVSALGERVTSNLTIGDRVIIYLYDTCGECEACKSGEDTFCLKMGPLLGFTRPGGFAEYVSVPAKNVFKVADNLPLEEAALLPDAVLTPYHAIVDRAKVQFNESVLLLGMGGLALNALQVLKLMGTRVIAVSRTKDKLDLATRLGADVTINSSNVDLPLEVRKATEGKGVDCALDFVASASTIDQCLRSLARGGRVVLLGYSLEPPAVSTSLLISQIASLQASRSGTRADMRDIIKLASEGKIKTVLNEIHDLSEVNTLLNRLSSGQVTGRVALKI